MKEDLVDKIVNSVLYEGYMLYPYRKSSVKNQQQWNFGIVYPRNYKGELSTMTTECLVVGDHTVKVNIAVRFIQALEHGNIERRIVPGSFHFGVLTGTVEVTITKLRQNL